MDQYILGPPKTVSVDGSVPLLAADISPTSGIYAGMQAEKATITAVGAVFMETGGGAASSASFPMDVGDTIAIDGYQNLKRLQFIKAVGATTIVWIPAYR